MNKFNNFYNNNFRVKFHLIISLLLILILASVGDAAPKWTKVRELGGVSEYKFANGLTALIAPDSAKPLITLNVVYKFGAAYENDGMRGGAHLMEHLLYAGTKNHRNITQEINSRGGNANGGTSLEYTTYYVTFPASGANLDWALSLESERMTQAIFARPDLERERSVVLNEMKMGQNNNIGVLIGRMLSAAYDWSSSGHSVIGNENDLNSVTYDQIRKFYAAHSRPELATVVVAGDVKGEEAIEAVAKYFGSIPKPATPVPALPNRETPQDGTRSVILLGNGDYKVVAALYHGAPAAHKDAAALDIAANILTIEPSGRLYKSLVKTKVAGWANAFMWGQTHQSPFFALAQIETSKSESEAQKILLQTVASLADNPPTEEEMRLAKERYIKDMDLSFAHIDRFALQLTDWISMGDWRLFFYYRDIIPKITADDVVRAAKKYLVPQNLTIGQFIPTQDDPKVKIPSAVPSDILLRDYKPSSELKLGEKSDTSPEALDKNILIKEVKSETGNIRAAFLKKKSRGGLVTVHIALHFGALNNLTDKQAAGGMTAQMLSYGTTKHTREQISEIKDRLKAEINIGGGAHQVSVNIVVPQENLAEAVKLAAECLRYPAFGKDELDVLKNELISDLNQAKSDPARSAQNYIDRLFSPYKPGDVRYVMGFDEQIRTAAAVKPEDLQAFHKEFYGAKEVEIAFVGDFDMSVAENLAQNIFKDWTSKAEYERIPVPYADIPAKKEILTFKDKANATIAAASPVRINADADDYAAVRVAAAIMGGGFLDSRMSNRIREKDATSYRVSMKINIPNFDDFGMWNFTAIMAPKDAKQVEAAFFDELNKALLGGFTQEEVARAKQNLIASIAIDLSQDERLAHMMTFNLYKGRTYAHTAALLEQIKAVTPQSAHKALIKYLNPADFSVVTAGDF